MAQSGCTGRWADYCPAGRNPVQFQAETSFGDSWLEGHPILLGAGAVDANRDVQIGITIPQWLPQGEAPLSAQSMFQLSPPAGCGSAIERRDHAASITAARRVA
jgi:hypothetical protein